MWYLIVKAALSGVLIAIITEVAKRYPGFGGMFASLPLVADPAGGTTVDAEARAAVAAILARLRTHGLIAT
jgi:hypothetical protein